MKILVAGDWHSELHEEVVSKALSDLGHELADFRWFSYFDRPSLGPVSHAVHLWRRFQNKYIVGPQVARLNRDFLELARSFKPDVIFVYRGTHIKRETLEVVKRHLPQSVLIGYNNDDPFSVHHAGYLWRHFLNAIPAYDLVLAYRHANIAEYHRAGAHRVEFMRSWFVSERNHRVSLSEAERSQFESDVVFVGHYEDDQRLAFLEEIVRQGYRLRLFGPGYDWDPVLRKSPTLRGHVPVRLVWGDDYNRALCGARIALCFFSKLNRDTYTRRCFEIPASGTLLLSEFSSDLASLYCEGVEADFFRSRDEMMEKIRKYLSDDLARTRVADAGARRVREDGHDVGSRMRQLLAWVSDIQSENMKKVVEG